MYYHTKTACQLQQEHYTRRQGIKHVQYLCLITGQYCLSETNTCTIRDYYLAHQAEKAAAATIKEAAETAAGEQLPLC